MASKVEAGDADPPLGIENKTGATGIARSEMCLILIRVKAMDQERPAVLGKSKAEQQSRCWTLVKDVPPKGQDSGRLVASQQPVASMAVASKMNHQVFPGGDRSGRDSRDDIRGNRTIQFYESGIPDTREPVIGELGMKVNRFPLTAGFSRTGRELNKAV